jgi:hypothetical protein
VPTSRTNRDNRYGGKERWRYTEHTTREQQRIRTDAHGRKKNKKKKKKGDMKKKAKQAPSDEALWKGNGAGAVLSTTGLGGHM